MSANQHLYVNYSFCAMYWVWGYNYANYCWTANWDRFHNWFPYNSHEHRNLPVVYDDWTGVDFDQPYAVSIFGMWVQNPAEKVKIDFKLKGHLTDTDEWRVWSNNTGMYVRHNPIRPQYGYGTQCKHKFHFSFEKKTTCINGFYWSYRWWYWTFWSFNSFYYGLFWHNPWRWVWQDNYFWGGIETMSFPRNLKTMRIRQSGAGQQAQGYEWYRTSFMGFWGINLRFVHVKSTLKVDQKPLCLTDTEAFSGWRARPMDATKCNVAAAIGDGREIFAMYSFPNLVKWNEGNQRVGWERYDRVMMRYESDNRDNILVWANDSNIEAYNHDKCIEIKGTVDINFMNAISSTWSAPKKWMLDNEIIKLFSPTPQKFHFLPNLRNPWLQVNFKSPNQYVESLEVSWDKPPSIYVVYCYYFRWYVQDIVFTKGTSTQNINFVDATCSSIYVLVIAYDKHKSKCKEGNCIVLNSLKPKSKSTQITWQKCDLRDKKKKDSGRTQSFFLEPADIGTFYTYVWWQNYYFNWRNYFMYTLIKFRQYKINLKIIEGQAKEALPVDLYVDQQIGLERCTKGACLKLLKKKKYLPQLYKELFEVAGRLVSNVDAKYWGESKQKPAGSCSFIKKYYNNDVNGYYWINNTVCSKEPIKMYCKMNEKNPTGMILENGLDINGFNISHRYELMQPENFLAVCGQKGLRTAKIESIADLHSLVMLSFDQHFQFNRSAGIIIGYDFNCKKYKGCSTNYYSLDGTVKLNDIAKEFNKKIGKNFYPIRDNEALVLINGVIKTVKLSETWINSIVCQSIDEFDMYPLKCNNTLDDLPNMPHYVACPKKCLGALYGDGVFSSDSSICTAVRYSGEYTESEDFLYALMTPNKNMLMEFKSGTRNKVTSRLKKGQSVAFSIGRHSDFLHHCPIEKHKLISTFMQLKSKVQLMNKSLTSNKDKNAEIQSYINSLKSKLQQLEVIKQKNEEYQDVNNQNRNQNYLNYAQKQEFNSRNYSKTRFQISTRNSANKINTEDDVDDIDEIDSLTNLKNLKDAENNTDLNEGRDELNSARRYSDSLKSARESKDELHDNLGSRFNDALYQEYNSPHQSTKAKLEHNSFKLRPPKPSSHKRELDSMNAAQYKYLKNVSKFVDSLDPELKDLGEFRKPRISNYKRTSIETLPRRSAQHNIYVTKDINDKHTIYKKGKLNYQFGEIHAKNENKVEKGEEPYKLDLDFKEIGSQITNKDNKRQSNKSDVTEAEDEDSLNEDENQDENDAPANSSSEEDSEEGEGDNKKRIKNQFSNMFYKYLPKNPDKNFKFDITNMSTLKDISKTISKQMINGSIDKRLSLKDMSTLNSKSENNLNAERSMNMTDDISTLYSSKLDMNNAAQMKSLQSNFKQQNLRFVQGPNDPSFKQVTQISDEALFKFMQTSKKKDDWKKIFPKHNRDLRPDETKDKKYYKNKDLDNWQEEIFKKTGDQTVLSTMVDKTDQTKNPVFTIAYSWIKEWREIIKVAYKIMWQNTHSMQEHEKLLPNIMRDYKILNGYAIFLARLCNKMIKNAMRTMAMLEDKYLSLFKFVDNAYRYEIVQGVSMPLPDTFHIFDEKDTISQWKLTLENVTPHAHAFTQKTKTPSTDKYFNSIVNTRYQRAFDGEFYLSFKMAEKEGVFGAVFRYTDMFINYSVEFDYKHQVIRVIKRDPFNGDSVLYLMKYVLVPDFWYRAVIEFKTFVYKIHLTKETSVGSGDLDKKQAKKDLKEIPIILTAYDAGFKSGAVGWYCKECLNVQIDDVELYQDVCIRKSGDSTRWLLKSPYTFRYREKYVVPDFFMTWDSQDLARSIKASDWKYTKATFGRKGTIVQKGEHKAYDLMIRNTPSTMAYLRDKSFLCINYCTFNMDVWAVGDRQGLYSMFLKYKDRGNWLAVSIYKSKKWTRVTFINNVNGKFYKLSQYMNRNMILKGDTWYGYRVIMREGAVDMWVKYDNRWFKMFGQLKSPVFLNLEGTLGLGTNYSQTHFDKVWVTKRDLPPHNKQIQQAKQRAAAERKTANLDMDNAKTEVADDVPMQDYGSEIDKELQTIRYYDCTKAKSLETRNLWCTDSFNDRGIVNSYNVKTCNQNFCGICCASTVDGSRVNTCKAACSQGETKMKLDTNLFAKCLLNDVTLTYMPAKLNKCLNCCSGLKNPLVDSSSIQDCSDKCYSKYDLNPHSLSYDYFDNHYVVEYNKYYRKLMAELLKKRMDHKQDFKDKKKDKKKEKKCSGILCRLKKFAKKEAKKAVKDIKKDLKKDKKKAKGWFSKLKKKAKKWI